MLCSHLRLSSSLACVGRWAGYRPAAQGSSLYPNEVSSDFAFIPFGGGARKCVGDQFALMEAAVILAMLLRQAAKLPGCSSSLLPYSAEVSMHALFWSLG